MQRSKDAARAPAQGRPDRGRHFPDQIVGAAHSTWAAALALTTTANRFRALHLVKMRNPVVSAAGRVRCRWR